MLDESGDASEEESDAPGDTPPEISRSVPLSSKDLQITGTLDLVTTQEDLAVPTETKRGRVPDNAERSWEPERVQLMAQGLLLREHGYSSTHGILYFASSKTRVQISFSPELEERTFQYIREAIALSECNVCPPPLDDSPKCGGCSLAGICMPDETRMLSEQQVPDIRRLFSAREYAVPLYVQEQGARVGKSGLEIVVRKKDEILARVKLKDMSQLVLLGNISVTAQTINWLCQEDVPIVHLTMGHWFCGITTGISLRNAYSRVAQYKTADAPERCLEFAKSIVQAKAYNQRTMVRRNSSKTNSKTLSAIQNLMKKIKKFSINGTFTGIGRQCGGVVFWGVFRTYFAERF